jgi:hypothetical protein
MRSPPLSLVTPPQVQPLLIAALIFIVIVTNIRTYIHEYIHICVQVHIVTAYVGSNSALGLFALRSNELSIGPFVCMKVKVERVEIN